MNKRILLRIINCIALLIVMISTVDFFFADGALVLNNTRLYNFGKFFLLALLLLDIYLKVPSKKKR